MARVAVGREIRRSTPVLILVDESIGCLWATRGLAYGGFAPWVGASAPETYAGRSRAAAGLVVLPDPEESEVAYVDAVAAAASVTNAAVILPATDASLHVLTGRQAELTDGPPVATGARAALDRATDKTLLPDLAREAGLSTPMSIEVTADAVDALREFSYPIVLKPLRTYSATSGTHHVVSNAVIAPTIEVARKILSDGVPRLAQPRIEGELWSVAGVATDGDVVCMVPQRSPRIWPPLVGGTSYAETLPADDDLEARVRRLVAAIGWSGMFHVQFLHNSDGDFLIDFNPRVYGSIGLAIAAGLNLPAIWAELALGRTPHVSAYRPKTRFRFESREARALLTEWRSGRRLTAVAGAAPRRRTAHAVFAFRDPGPAALTVAKAARRLRTRRREAGD